MTNSQKLKKARKKAGLTQRQASDMLKNKRGRLLSIDTYRKWEQGITNVDDFKLDGIKKVFSKSHKVKE